jgi:hypothetical protein
MGATLPHETTLQKEFFMSVNAAQPTKVSKRQQLSQTNSPSTIVRGVLLSLFFIVLVVLSIGTATDGRGQSAKKPNANSNAPNTANRSQSADQASQPKPEQPKKLTDEDYKKHVAALKKRLPDAGFTVIVSKPFVVIGDDEPEDVRNRAKNTVAWAVRQLKETYFDKEPAEILDIWLFKDKESYEKHATKMFKSKPDTPYGYYSSADKALVMNISTGGGTLVHEIVHPFMAANFPACPSWFNEGLASLYEQSGEENGKIHGYPNWRLPGLQKSIRDKKVLTFKELCATTTKEFYEKDRGSNYSQARYLCYYLQQKNLLQKYYKTFLADCENDPTGYDSLQKVLERTDMEQFQKEWEQYVLKLRRD